MATAKAFASFDFEAVHRESSARLAAITGQLSRHSLFLSRPSTTTLSPEQSVALSASSTKQTSRSLVKTKPKKQTDLSQAERRRRLEKALETDRLRDERIRRERVEALSESTAVTAQPFGNRTERFFFARPEMPKFLTANLLREFELVPTKFEKPGNFPPVEFAFGESGETGEEDVLPSEFTRSEISVLLNMVTRFAAFHKPSKEFPSSLVSRGVFARLLIVLGIVAESRYNRLASLATNLSGSGSGSGSGGGGLLGLGTNLEILGAFPLQEALEIFDMHASTVELFPFPKCMHASRTVKLLEWLFFETERRSQEAGTKDRRKQLRQMTGNHAASLAVMMSVNKVGSKLKARRKNRLFTNSGASEEPRPSTSSGSRVSTAEKKDGVTRKTAIEAKFSTMRNFFFQVMTRRVEEFLDERSRKLEHWKIQASGEDGDAESKQQQQQQPQQQQEPSGERTMSQEEKEKLAAPPGVSRREFEEGMKHWKTLQLDVTETQRTELGQYAWKMNEYVSCSLVEPEVLLASVRLTTLAREIVRAYSSANFQETLGIGGEGSAEELERIGTHMKFSDLFRFFVDFGIYPEYVNFQQVKELYVGVDLLSEFTPVSEYELQVKRLDEQENSFKEKGWMYKSPTEMTQLERKAFTVLSSVEQWISDRFFRVKDVFMQFDADKNGFLSPYEFHAAVQRLEISMGGKKLTPEEIDRIMNISDSDVDGQLSLDEFDKALARMKEAKTHIREKQNFATKSVNEMSTNERRALSALHSLGKYVDRNSFEIFWTKVDADKAGKVTTDFFASYLGMNRQSLGLSSHVASDRLLDVVRLFETRLDGNIHESDMRSSLTKIQGEVRDPFHETTKAKKGQTQILFATPALTELLIKMAVRVASHNPQNFDLQTAPAFLKVHWLISLVLKREKPAVSDAEAVDILRASEKVLTQQARGRRMQATVASEEQAAFKKFRSAEVDKKMDAIGGVSEAGTCGVCSTESHNGWGFIACRHCSPLGPLMQHTQLVLETLMSLYCVEDGGVGKSGVSMGKPTHKPAANKAKRPPVKRNPQHSLSIKSFFKSESRPLVDPASIVALDCEMVEAVGNKDVLARVSIVSFSGKVLLDCFVRQDLEIKDYRTDVTGVDAELLRKSGLAHADVLARVSVLLKDKVVVGHGLNNDFDVVEIAHPEISRRDTAGYRGLRPVGREDKVPALRTLVALHLDGRVIQQGAHSSVEDARCALALYKKVMHLWEAELAKTRKSQVLTDAQQRRHLRKARRDGVKRAALRKDVRTSKAALLDAAMLQGGQSAADTAAVASTSSF